MAGLLELIGDQAVAELRVIGVDVVGDVDQVRLLHITIADRGRAPLVEGPLAEAQHPAGHRYRDPLEHRRLLAALAWLNRWLEAALGQPRDRKSTRLNSSNVAIAYAV